MKVMIVKELMTGDVSPVAMFSFAGLLSFTGMNLVEFNNVCVCLQVFVLMQFGRKKDWPHGKEIPDYKDEP